MMIMDPKDQKSELNPGHDWEQDLEVIRSALPDLDSAEPPEMLDQAVLNSARRDLATTRRQPARWIGAIATAAVVVLALSIVVQQDQKTPEPGIGNGIQLNTPSPAVAEKEAPVATAITSELQHASPPPSATARDEPAALEKQGFESKKLKDTAGSLSASSPEEVDHMAQRSLMKVNDKHDSQALAETGVEESRAQAEDDKSVSPAISLNDFDVVRERVEETESNVLPTDSSARDKAELSGDEAILAPDAWIEYMLELQKAEKLEDLKAELEAFRIAYPSITLPAELED